MDRVLLVLIASMALIGCFGDRRVVCFSGGQLIAEYYVEGPVWGISGGFSFDLHDGTSVSVRGDCIVEEIQN